MCNVVGVRVVGCLLFVSFQSIHASQTEVKSSLLMDTLYSCLLSLWSLSHTLIIVYIVVYICFIATENSSVFNLCCTEPVQHSHVHSIHWPFTHPFTCKRIHIQLTIRSYHRQCYHTTTCWQTIPSLWKRKSLGPICQGQTYTMPRSGLDYFTSKQYKMWPKKIWNKWVLVL